MNSPPRQASAARADVRRRGGGWSNLVLMFVCALQGWVQVLYLRDTPDTGRLALLIFASVVFGVAAAQLPPVRSWLDRKRT